MELMLSRVVMKASFQEREGLFWKVYKEPDSDLTIIAFEATQNSSNLQVDLVPCSVLREENFTHFDFLCTAINPTFFVNSTAFSLFRINQHSLDQLKSEVHHLLSHCPMHNLVFHSKTRNWWCVDWPSLFILFLIELFDYED